MSLNYWSDLVNMLEYIFCRLIDSVTFFIYKIEDFLHKYFL